MSELKLYKNCQVNHPKQLVVMLHGYGANGENLIDLAHEFRRVLPEACFIAPNAVQPWEGGFPNAYQWFSLASGFGRKALSDMAEDIKSSQQKLKQLIDQQLKELGLEAKDLFLVGFSQGAMMAIYQALSRQEKIAGVVAFSGRLILPEMLQEKTFSKPEICLIHGEIDSVVPFENFLEAKKVLTEKDFIFESHAISNLDHSIDLRGIRAANNFFKNQLLVSNQ